MRTRAAAASASRARTERVQACGVMCGPERNPERGAGVGDARVERAHGAREADVLRTRVRGARARRSVPARRSAPAFASPRAAASACARSSGGGTRALVRSASSVKAVEPGAGAARATMGTRVYHVVERSNGRIPGVQTLSVMLMSEVCSIM
jgi:hypothetical protein